MSIAKDKDPSIRVKMHKIYIFLFLPLFVLYLLSGCDLFNMPCLSEMSLMTVLDILCSNPSNLKNKIVKIEHIHEPHSTLRLPPTYLMYGP